MNKNTLLLAIALCMAAIPGLAQAQDVPATAAAQHAETVTDLEAAPEEDSTVWNVTLGGVLNAGNTQSWQLNAGTRFELVRGIHSLAAEATFNIGEANPLEEEPPVVDEFVQTVRNFNAKARYDLYLSHTSALFAAVAFRWDTFAGLDSRIQGQVGYLQNFFREEGHRFWGEIGYDITIDDYFLPLDPTTGLEPEAGGDAVIHAARLYFGYDNHLNENVTFRAGVEVLANLNSFDQAALAGMAENADGTDTIDTFEDLRVNFDAEIRSAISGRLQLALLFKLLFDNAPVAGKLNHDIQTTVNLTYSLM